MAGTYTQDDVDAAVAAALAPLKEQLSKMEAEMAEAGIEARIAEASAELTKQIEDLQAQLDTKVLEAEEARKSVTDITAYLDAVAAEAQAAADQASRKEVRLALVREVASFPDEYIDANADRWASLEDEAFEALVNDWRAIASKKPEETQLPAATAMVASRTEPAKTGSAVAELFALSVSGTDFRAL